MKKSEFYQKIIRFFPQNAGFPIISKSEFCRSFFKNVQRFDRKSNCYCSKKLQRPHFTGWNGTECDTCHQQLTGHNIILYQLLLWLTLCRYCNLRWNEDRNARLFMYNGINKYQFQTQSKTKSSSKYLELIRCTYRDKLNSKMAYSL